ncbi:MAG: YetF domain-containing protein, partial [Xanthobacteraceae bacterium]
IEGTPKILVRHGRRCADVMAREQVSISELTEAMRREGCSSIAEVRVALLENDGTISVIRRAHD